jgi:hypothetical protein
VLPYIRRIGTQDSASCTGTPQSVLNNDPTQVRFGATEGAAQGGFNGADCSATNISLPRAGVYVITASVLWASNTAGIRSVIVRASTNNIAVSRIPPAGSGETHQSVSAVYRATAGQNVDVTVTQTSGGSLALGPNDGRTHLAIAWIGAGAP